MLLDVSKTCLPMLSTPAQVLAQDIVDLEEVDITMIEVLVEKLKDEWAIEITQNILENTVIVEPVKITYLSSSSDEAVSESNRNDGGEFGEAKGSTTKTEQLGYLPGENK